MCTIRQVKTETADAFYFIKLTPYTYWQQQQYIARNMQEAGLINLKSTSVSVVSPRIVNARYKWPCQFVSTFKYLSVTGQ